MMALKPAVLVARPPQRRQLRPSGPGSAGPVILSAPAATCDRIGWWCSCRGRQPWTVSMASCAPLRGLRSLPARRGAHQLSVRRESTTVLTGILRSTSFPKNQLQGPEISASSPEWWRASVLPHPTPSA